MSVAADRAACAVHFWCRRGDKTAARVIFNSLTQDQWEEVVWLLCTFHDDLRNFTDEELLGRMLGLAAAPAPEIF